jgi:hypothetical protein
VLLPAQSSAAGGSFQELDCALPDAAGLQPSSGLPIDVSSNGGTDWFFSGLRYSYAAPALLQL